MSEHTIKIAHDYKNVRDTVIEVDDLGNIAKMVTTIEIDIRPGGVPAQVKLGLHLPVVRYDGKASIELKVTDLQTAVLSHFGWIHQDDFESAVQARIEEIQLGDDL